MDIRSKISSPNSIKKGEIDKDEERRKGRANIKE